MTTTTKPLTTREFTRARALGDELRKRSMQAGALRDQSVRELLNDTVCIPGTDRYLLPDGSESTNAQGVIRAWGRAAVAARVRDALANAVECHGNFASGFVVLDTEGHGGHWFSDNARPRLDADERKISLRHLTLNKVRAMTDDQLINLVGAQ
jgi:hypothetical protein